MPHREGTPVAAVHKLICQRFGKLLPYGKLLPAPASAAAGPALGQAGREAGGAERSRPAGPGRAGPECSAREAALPRHRFALRSGPAGMAGEPLSFRAFHAARPAGCQYGYGHGEGLSALRDREFPRLRGTAGGPGAGRGRGRPGPFPARMGRAGRLCYQGAGQGRGHR